MARPACSKVTTTFPPTTRLGGAITATGSTRQHVSPAATDPQFLLQIDQSHEDAEVKLDVGESKRLGELLPDAGWPAKPTWMPNGSSVYWAVGDSLNVGRERCVGECRYRESYAPAGVVARNSW